MRSKAGMIYVLKSGTAVHWWAIIKQTLYNALLSLIPIWAGIVLIILGAPGPTWNRLAQEGEFALYSAALLGPVFYQLFKDFKKNEFPGRHWFGLSGILLMFLSTIIYLVGFGFSTIQKENMVAISIIVFLSAQLLAFSVGIVDIILSDMDYEKESRIAVDSLSDAMDKEGVKNE